MSVSVAIAVGVGAVLVICAADVIAPRLRTAAPLLLVLAGIVASFVPGVPALEVEPDLILEVILPPLLYASAVAMPTMSFRRDLTGISALAVPLVVASALLVGLFLAWRLPDLGLLWGVALGAVLSPTDAVATSIIKGRGAPPRVITMLEGESLLNDASALVLLSTATAATTAGFSLAGAVGTFAWSVAVAVLIGGVVGVGNFLVRRRITSATVNTVLSFTLPFIASVPTEMLGGSGLVAAVIAGLVTGFRGPRMLPPEHRRSTGTTWASIQTVLEGLVFLTMGLQLRGIVEELHGESVGLLAGLGLAVLSLVAILAVRTVFVAVELAWLARRARHGEDMRPRIEAMQTRLDTSRRLSQQHLEALDRARAALGEADPDPARLAAAYEEQLRQMAAEGDELAQHRLRIRDDARAVPTARGSRRAGRGPFPVRAGGGTVDLIRATDGDATSARDRRHLTAPDPERLERWDTRLRRVAADIGYLASQPLGRREGTLLVWAGMRGAVTVAAAQTLPEETPHRALLVFVAFSVATLSLLVQGGTVGLVVGRLFGRERSEAEVQREAEQRSAIIALLDAAAAEADADLPEDVSDKQRRLARLRTQRSRLLDARDDGLFDADSLEGALEAVDAEEIGLELRGGPEG